MLKEASAAKHVRRHASRPASRRFQKVEDLGIRSPLSVFNMRENSGEWLISVDQPVTFVAVGISCNLSAIRSFKGTS